MTDPHRLAAEPWMERLLGDLRPEQRQGVISPRSLVVVQAGAGTGKTHTLSSRFAWLLASDPTCRVEQILTLTFTEKAAREMRDRIRCRLLQWLEAEPEKLGHLRDAAARIDEGYISTLHAFALRVIRESGLVLDLDPESRIASPCGEGAFFEEMEGAFDRLDPAWFLRLLEDPWRDRCQDLFGDPAFPRLVNALSPRRLAELVREAAELHGSRDHTPEDLWTRAPFDPVAAADRIAQALEPRLREIRNLWDGDLLPSLGADLDRDGSKMGEALRGFLARTASLPWDGEGDRRFVRELFEGPLKRLPGTSKLKALLEEGLGSSLKDWRDDRASEAELARSLEEGISPEEDALLERICRVCALGWAAWDASRMRSGALIFRDLIALARQALERNPAYASRFRHLLVDEFQDTDPLQDRLVQALWEGGKGSLFVVGDLKQSVYRFRHADLALFDETLQRARATGGDRISLDCSYRTRGKLLEGINGLFGSLWEEGLGAGLSLGYDPLRGPEETPWWEERNALPGPALEVLTATPREPEEEEGEPSKEKVDELRLRLYGTLAARFRSLVETGAPVWDKAQRRHRPAAYRDLAVLVPTRADYPLLEEAFTAFGVPGAFTAAVGFFTRGEVRDLADLLASLADPRDPLALGSFLASPFSGLPLDGVLPRLGRGDLGEDPELAAGVAERDRLRRIALLEGGTAALEALLARPSWLAAYPPGARRRVLGNLRTAADLAASFEATFGPSLPGTAAYLGQALARELPQAEPELLEDEDAVRVLTVHAAKGLEFPVVAVVRLEKTPEARGKARVLPSRHLGLSLGSWPPVLEPPEASPVRSGLWEGFFEEAGTREEWQRLLYVAATRAQDRLWLLGTQRRGQDGTIRGAAGSWMEVLRKHPLPGAVWEEVETAPEGSSPPPPSAPTPLLRPLALPPREETPLARLSATAYSLFRFCPLAYRMRFRQGLDPAWEGGSPLDGGPGGADLGSLAHWVLARWDGRGASLPRWLASPEGERGRTLLNLLPQDLRPLFRDASVRETLERWLGGFSETPWGELFRTALSLPSCRREVPFRVPLGETLLVGAVDLLWQDGSGLHLRDHKTARSAEAAKTLYSHQLRFYALAARRAHGEAPDLALWLLRPRNDGSFPPPLEVPPPGDWDLLEEEVRAVAAQAARGPYPPERSRCPSCPWRNGCPEGTGKNGPSKGDRKTV